MATISQWWMWLIFFSLVIVVLLIDLLLLQSRKSHSVSTKEALYWTAIWFSLAIIFNLFLWWYLRQNYPITVANQKALEFFTGYLIEKSLSVDNIFIFLMIFKYFSIPAEYQRRVLIYGVLGAIVMRLLLILFGIWLVMQFYWVLYVFGLFLIFTGIKMATMNDQQAKLANNPLLRWMRTHLRVTPTLSKDKFLIRQNNLLFVTPLFLTLILIEVSDLIFAVDSIPAIFAITNDPFLIFTSNIFAIMGLRALYFLLANLHERFHYLKYGLAFILVLIGIKMLVAHWINVPIYVSLGLILSILFASILASLYRDKYTQRG